VQHRAHLVGRQVDIRFAVVAQYETMAVAVAGNGALEFSEQTGGMGGRSARRGVSCFDKKSLFVGGCWL